MSIMDELKKLTRPYDDDDSNLIDDDDLDLEEDEPSYTRPVAQTVPQPEPAVSMGDSGMGAGMGTGMGTGMGGSMGMNGLGGMNSMGGMNGSGLGDVPRTGNVSPINMGAPSDNSKYRVVLVKPEEFDAATAIAKHICQGDTVILNCEDTNEQVARRVIDFLSGCAFALDGSIRKASSNVIIIAPKDVGVDEAKDDDRPNG